MSTNTLSLPTRDGLFIPKNAFGLDTKAGARNMLADKALRHLLGMVPAVAGGSAPLQGYNTEGDVIRTTTDGVDLNTLWAEFTRLLQAMSARRQPLVDLLTYTVPKDIEQVPQVGNNATFERASEFGLPKAIRTDVDYFNMGFSFDWFDTGIRYTWRYLAEADAQQVASANVAIIEADNRLVFNTVMWTLFNNANRQAEIRGNMVTVYAFYNNDGTVPPSYGPNNFLSTHNHYLVSGGAVVDSQDLDDTIKMVTEHGYNNAEGYDVVVLVNEQELNVIRTFKSVQNGGSAKYDFIPALGTPNFLLPVNFIVANDGDGRPSNAYRGITVAGRYGDALILTNDYFPAGYLTVFATGGPENLTNPIGIREHARQEYRGLRLIKGRSPDYPLQESYYLRGFGTGVRHRGASGVMQIKASGLYAPPTAYSVRP